MDKQRRPKGANALGRLDLHRETFGALLRSRRVELGLTQVALGLRGCLDNSIISRFETGQLLPGRTDFDLLASILKLTSDEQDRWRFALQQDILQRKSVPADGFLRPDELMFLASTYIDSVRKLRLDGRPQLAASEAVKYGQWVRVFVQRVTNDVTRNALLSCLAELLIEQCKSYMDYVLPQEAWSVTQRLILEQEEIAKLTQDPQLSLLAGISTEATLYVSGQHKDADRICRSLLTNRKMLEDQWQPEVLRAGAINMGNLGDTNGMVSVAVAITRMVEEGKLADPMTATFLLEGLARGQGALGDRRALETIHTAWELLEKGRNESRYSSLRMVQLIRTQLRTMQTLGAMNPVEFERLGNRGLLICDELGYLRYTSEINALLRASLDQ